MQLQKRGKILGSSLIFGTSTIAFVASATTFPWLSLPLLGTSLYTGQKVLNNTLYKSFKDLAFVARKKGNNMYIEQDVLRPDIFRLVRGLDTREKLGFLQLQTLIGMTKFDANDKNGNPLTLETISHGMVRNTFQKLNELGYIQNYQEQHTKDRKLMFAKLAFANLDFMKNTSMFKMTFQRTNKPIDFEDPDFRRMFPMVFGKNGLLAKKGYTIVMNQDGSTSIDYGNKNEEKRKNKQVKPRPNIRDELKVPISLEEQRTNAEGFLEGQGNTPRQSDGNIR